MQNSSLGNVISRLQGLKNVSGRKVMPGAEFLQDLEEPPSDVSGTAPPLPNFANFLPNAQNQPEPDLGGELTPQSYDVRANVVKPPEQEEQGPGFWSRVGSALADYVNPQKRQEMSASNEAMMNRGKPVSQTPPIETAQVDTQEGLPPVTASEQESPGFFGALKNEATKPYHGATLGGAWEGAKNFVKESLTPKLDPIVYERNPNLKKPPELVQQQEQQQQTDQEAMNKAQEDPWSVAAYGATDAFANKPELVSEFETYTGTQFDEQKQEMTKKYEQILSDLDKGRVDNEAAYDEQSKRIQQRIVNNQATDADKYYIGLALLMPLLVGGLFGKQAGLGALAGGAKGIADVLGQRQKDIRADEESLTEINKQRAENQAKRGELDIERLKIPAEVKKNMPKDEFEDLKGMKIHSFKDPKTGKVIGGGPEVLPDLYLDLNYGNSIENRKDMRKTASKLEEEKSALERANSATSDVIKAASQLKDPGMFSKILAYALSDDDNGALKKLVRQNAPEIIVDGRKQNSAVYIDSKIEQMKDAYRRNEQMKAFTNTVAAHIGNMAENPQYSGLKPSDLIDQMLILRDRGQQFFVDRAGSQGFLKEPLENKFGKLNRELYKGLNRKEEKSQLERDKQLMHASE